MKRSAIQNLICFAAVFFLFPVFLYAEPSDQNVVARVNGVAITAAELERATDTYVPPGTYHMELGVQKRKEYRKPALEMLIDRELLFQEAVARGITAKNDEVSSALEEVEQQFKRKADFDLALRNTGVTLEEYREALKRNISIDKLLKAEVEDKGSLSDKELEEYYNRNKEKFLKPEAFKVWHILLKVPAEATDEERGERKSQAQDLMKKLEAGEDFSELAGKYSGDDYRVKGGDLGWVHMGRLEAALDEALSSLQPGNTVMVETIYGYHILRLEAKRPPEQLELNDIKGTLKQDLEAMRRKDNRDALMDFLKKKARIEKYTAAE
ncbi:MAG: peptidylprolyl isomerase [Thermodesulfovibrionales bacterium]|jgi:peptidyl-prolyl cis-trans isomerase C